MTGKSKFEKLILELTFWEKIRNIYTLEQQVHVDFHMNIAILQTLLAQRMEQVEELKKKQQEDEKTLNEEKENKNVSSGFSEMN